MTVQNPYKILGVENTCDFRTLKRAYYRRAMECHPDRFSGDPAKAEEFKRLAEAFNLLSDPVSRMRYDAATSPSSFQPIEEDAILDTVADDILEEMIVGNSIPVDTSLQTLMLDLERTEQFCLFREGKTYFYKGQVKAAAGIFRTYLIFSPVNLLAHYYLGRCLEQQGQFRRAARAYAEAIRWAGRRTPPLHVPRIRRELEKLRRERLGLAARVRSFLSEQAPPAERRPPDEQMRLEVSRAIRRYLNEEAKQRKFLEGPKSGD